MPSQGLPLGSRFRHMCESRTCAARDAGVRRRSHTTDTSVSFNILLQRRGPRAEQLQTSLDTPPMAAIRAPGTGVRALLGVAIVAVLCLSPLAYADVTHEQQMEEIRKFFESADTDGSGMLEPEEFTIIINGMLVL